MLNITYNSPSPTEHLLIFDGHCDYEKPVDRVCAASSALFYTLMANLEKLKDQMDSKFDVEYGETDDETAKFIKVITQGYATNLVKLAFVFTLTGLETITVQYPENVQIRCSDDRKTFQECCVTEE